MLDSRRPPFFTSLVDLLRYRAAKQPNDRAYVLLSDQGQEESVLTFAELDQRASDVAARLADGQIGDRALLLFGPGLDFIIAYFGCLLAGVIAVPMMLPRRNSARFEREHSRRLLPALCADEYPFGQRSAGCP